MGRSVGPAAAAVLAGECPSVDKLLASGPLQNWLSLHHIHSGHLSLLPAASAAVGKPGPPQLLEPGSCMQLEVGCSGSLMVAGGRGHDVAGPMLGGWSVVIIDYVRGFPPTVYTCIGKNNKEHSCRK